MKLLLTEKNSATAVKKDSIIRYNHKKNIGFYTREN